VPWHTDASKEVISFKKCLAATDTVSAHLSEYSSPVWFVFY